MFIFQGDTEEVSMQPGELCKQNISQRKEVDECPKGKQQTEDVEVSKQVVIQHHPCT